MDQLKNILLYIAYKERENFTGGIKMGFEEGRPHGFVETLNPDYTIPTIEQNFKLEDKIKKACSIDFYGTLLFILKSGKITHFTENRTYQGRILENMLNSIPINNHLNIKKKVILATNIRVKTHDAVPKM